MELATILDTRRDLYAQTIASFLQFTPWLLQIKRYQDETTVTEPYWINGWMPGLDGVALSSFIGMNRPARYYEIGSGNSTKFAARAVRDHGLRTKILSIDPQPRAEIDALCQTVIRAPVEDIDLRLFDELEANDILYIDSSHRSFMNSDVTVIFLDIIPRLKPGVIVEVHDITLPYDYPSEWTNRAYSEQYLLACYMLAHGRRFEVLFPSYFVSHDISLNRLLAPFWSQDPMLGVETHGCSFWFRMQ